MPQAVASNAVTSFSWGVPPKRNSAWPFDRKFRLWRGDARKSLSAMARETGIPYATLHGWAQGGVRATADGMAKIAAVTGLPAKYWTDPKIPYPPPADYFNVAEEVEREVRGLSPDRLQRVLDLLRTPGELDRALDLIRVARRPPPSETA